MTQHIHRFTASPSAWRYMSRAARRYGPWQPTQGFPDLELHWQDYRIAPDLPHTLRRLAATSGASDAGLLLLAPHITGFRLPMAMLTHPRWPLPIWRALQVRNRLIRHRPLVAGACGELRTGVGAWRVLDKGLEVDLHTRLLQDGATTWESIVTFYYRGRFGAAQAHGVERGVPRAAPGVGEATRDGGSEGEATRWRTASDGRWRFGRLTGDYNGLHLYDAYARGFGFAAAFAHPQRVVVECLAHLPAPDGASASLDLWVKGPVPFGREVRLRQAPLADAASTAFAVSLTDDPRPALVGVLGPGPLG